MENRSQNGGTVECVRFINRVRGGQTVNDQAGLKLIIAGVDESAVSFGE